MLDTTNLLGTRLGVASEREPTACTRLPCRQLQMPGLLAAAADDEHIGPLVVTGLVATRRLSPRSNRVTTARGLTFTTTVRVVDRVHRDTAVGRANALPAVASRLADGDVLVIGVAHLADGRHALDQHLAGLAGGQLEQSVLAFLGDQLHLRTSRAGH